jgi:hypothetical protein
MSARSKAGVCPQKESTSMTIAGYTHDSTELAPSPVSLTDLEEVKRTLLFGPEDARYLKLSLGILQDQVEAILDVWYGFVGDNPHLLASFSDALGKPQGEYLARVRGRFGRWILDTARADYDQAWLDYQHEIGLRHHRSKKNRTDAATASAIVPFRHLFALVVPITHTLRPFLAARGAPEEEVTRMQTAWLKTCLLQVTLWSHAYIKDGDF